MGVPAHLRPTQAHAFAPAPLTPQVLLEVARSVDYLHERKLLHCDLKVGRRGEGC